MIGLHLEEPGVSSSTLGSDDSPERLPTVIGSVPWKRDLSLLIHRGDPELWQVHYEDHLGWIEVESCL
jgi:hypothetical protein